MVIIVVLLLVVIAGLALGYSIIAKASSSQVANGVLAMTLAVGFGVWLVDNLTL